MKNIVVSLLLVICLVGKHQINAKSVLNSTLVT